MTLFYANASIGVVVNDLQRSPLIDCFSVCFVSIKQYVKARWINSILRGFKKEELLRFSEKLNFKNIKSNGNGLLDTNG
jgi:hypothetical protein